MYVFPLILYQLVRRQVCIQCTHNGGLGMPDLESHWLAERLAYLGRSLTGDAVWRLKASRTFPRLKSDPKASLFLFLPFSFSFYKNVFSVLV